MHPTNCLNCETLLTADDHFCPNCGQKANTHRLTIGHIIHEFIHTFTHADVGFLGMIADLLAKPGAVAREYIKGKRKKYFSPFTFFVLCVGVVVFSSHLFHVNQEHQKVDPHVLIQLPTQAAKQKYIDLINRLNNVTDFVGKNMNAIVMAVLPIYAFFPWIFFRKRGYNYSEQLVAIMLFQSLVALFMGIAVIPWLTKIKDKQLLVYAYLAFLLLTSIYVGVAQYAFLGFKKWGMIIVTSLITLFSYLVVFMIMVYSMTYYLFGSKAWKALEAAWHQVVTG